MIVLGTLFVPSPFCLVLMGEIPFTPALGSSFESQINAQLLPPHQVNGKIRHDLNLDLQKNLLSLAVCF